MSDIAEVFEHIRQLAWTGVGSDHETADKMLVRIHELAKKRAALHQQEQADPVGYWNPSADLDEIAFSYSNQGAYKIPLYRHPLSAVPSVTDSDMASIASELWTQSCYGSESDFIQAAIDAFYKHCTPSVPQPKETGE